MAQDKFLNEQDAELALAHLRRVLETYGSDMARWPQASLDGVAAILAPEAELGGVQVPSSVRASARAMLAEASAMDAAMMRALAAATEDEDGGLETDAAMVALASRIAQRAAGTPQTAGLRPELTRARQSRIVIGERLAEDAPQAGTRSATGPASMAKLAAAPSRPAAVGERAPDAPTKPGSRTKPVWHTMSAALLLGACLLVGVVTGSMAPADAFVQVAADFVGLRASGDTTALAFDETLETSEGEAL